MAVDGELRTEMRCPAPALGVTLGVCPFSNTPNSVASLAAGDGPREDERAELPTITLARRLAPPLAFSVGELVVDDRLEMRGILVGVSFVNAALELRDDGGGGSLKL